MNSILTQKFQRLDIEIENVNDKFPSFTNFTSGKQINLTENVNQDFFIIQAEDDENVPGTGNEDLTLVFKYPENNKPFTIRADGIGKWILSVNGIKIKMRFNFHQFYLYRARL